MKNKIPFARRLLEKTLLAPKVVFMLLYITIPFNIVC
jgi:hypothetical protein